MIMLLSAVNVVLDGLFVNEYNRKHLVVLEFSERHS